MKTVYQDRPSIDDLPARQPKHFPEIENAEFWDLYGQAKPYSLTNIPGFYNLYQSIDYLHRNRIAGDIAEFDCFLGGCGIFVKLMLRSRSDKRRMLVFDTFTGFPAGQKDVMRGKPVSSVRYDDFLEEVKDNYSHALADYSGVSFVQGPVEETLPDFKFSALALARLDTDFYSSTKAELKYAYPALVKGGVIIIDDYGMFQGSRRATDEYFTKEAPPLFNRINGTIWAGVKP